MVNPRIIAVAALSTAAVARAKTVRRVPRYACMMLLALIIPLLVACEGASGGTNVGRANPGGMLQDLSVPATAKIVTPDSGVPAQLASFSGAWAGRWDGTYYGRGWSIDSIVVVEKINADGTVEGTYVLGDAPEASIRRTSWKFRGKVVDGKLTWTSRQTRFEFSQNRDGKLAGRTFVNGIQDSAYVVLTKMVLPDHSDGPNRTPAAASP